tara:strand:+ start:147 stop:287 length:141 start_codon:yes stop_codon:yes gene_type:complete
MDGIIFIIVVGVIVGGIILKTENPNTYEKIKDKLKDYYENLRTYFK